MSDMKITSIRCTSIGNKYHLRWQSFTFSILNWLVTISQSSHNKKIMMIVKKNRVTGWIHSIRFKRSCSDFERAKRKRKRNWFEMILWQLKLTKVGHVLNPLRQIYDNPCAYCRLRPNKEHKNFTLRNAIKLFNKSILYKMGNIF